jgi:hypothetical protein
MSKYGYRDNKIEVEKITTDESNVSKLTLVKENVSKGVTYIAIPALTVGKVAPQTAYLFLGSAGRLCVSSTVPVGTTGKFVNKGLEIGTVV